MVTEKELSEMNFKSNNTSEKVSYQVTDEEMKKFEKNKDLPFMVYEKINQYAKENNIKPKYEGLEEICQLSETTLKKSVAGTQKITRTFLYKLAVGLRMKPDEANQFFKLCGGELREDDIEDYICMKALVDGDDIDIFIDDFNKYVAKYDKHKKSKLQKLWK